NYGIGLVLRSEDDKYPPGIYLYGFHCQTAYFGWKALAEDKAKMCKTLFVSVGGGPVGSFVVQYAKMNHPHLKIIALAGTQPKLDFIKSIAEHGPIDIYWDMTAGSILDAAVANMEDYGLIINFDLLFRRRITVRGFRSTDFMEQYLMQFLAEVPTLVLDGKIKPSEQRYLGLDKAEQALIDVHTGDNVGKAVVIVSDDA
ncbi:hypothetical protein PILCRDRAFT_94018, partial [Piloderma croceum F 1598]